MDIKLRARLSAYSKIDSVEAVSSNVPLPDATKAGNVLGVSNTGVYTLFPSINQERVDTLFTDEEVDTTVLKDEIDTLFIETHAPVVVTKDAVDTLFEDVDTPETVDKDRIDVLFQSNSTDTVSTYAIDTLFDA